MRCVRTCVLPLWPQPCSLQGWWCGRCCSHRSSSAFIGSWFWKRSRGPTFVPWASPPFRRRLSAAYEKDLVPAVAAGTRSFSYAAESLRLKGGLAHGTNVGPRDLFQNHEPMNADDDRCEQQRPHHHPCNEQGCGQSGSTQVRTHRIYPVVCERALTFVSICPPLAYCHLRTNAAAL